MKKLFIYITLFLAFVINGHAQTTPETQATEIAQKLKDSLGLSSQQKTQIENATVTIQAARKGLRELYTGRALDYYLMMSEQSRDTTYQAILPQDKYDLYLQKKTSLLSSY